jgi:hypothetical protein
MLNSSFFLKQLGYISILKCLLVFVNDPTFQVIFPKFITPELANTIWKVVRMEASQMEKDLKLELTRLRQFIETDVAVKLKEKINVKKDPSQKPTESFKAIRELLQTDHHSEAAIIDSIKRIDKLIDGNHDDVGDNRPARKRGSESMELSECLKGSPVKHAVHTESTKCIWYLI